MDGPYSTGESQNPKGACSGDGGRTVMHSELAIDARQVGLHGV